MKRDKRRAKRNVLLGPERKILVFTSELVTLECGHVIDHPKPRTTNVNAPKFYRCIECKGS
jgi:hypothetical protein